MQKKITQKELDFIGFLHTPRALLENLIPKEENSPSKWTRDCDCIKIRDYQIPFISYEYMVCSDPKLTDKENFEKKKGAGEIYNFSSRKTGKSFLSIKLDSLLDIMLNDNYMTCLASWDFIHLKNVAEWICDYVTNHPFFKMFHLRNSQKRTVNRGNYNIHTRNGHTLFSVNENIKGKSPGDSFLQHHYQKLYYEEIMGESRKGNEKRIDAESELGAIHRLTGVPAFKKASPSMGILGDSKKRNWLIRLPQYVSPFWDEQEKKERIKKYNGEQSSAYKLNVLAEIIQGANSAFDMEKVRSNFNSKKKVKFFEIGKKNYSNFRNEIIIESLKNSEKCYICADIGNMGTPSEIAIIFEVKGKYLYRYNITCNMLDHMEMIQIFLWLYHKLGNVIIGLDVTGGTGSAIYRELALEIPQKYLGWVHFSEKLTVGFEKDENDNIIYSKGEPKPKMEYVSLFSIQNLKELFYNNKFDLSQDSKLDRQIDSIICISSGNKEIYDTTDEDHLFQALQVFSITEFRNRELIIPKRETKLSLGIISDLSDN